MARLYAIICALRRYLWLHCANPKLSKCMVLSILLVIATAGPIARAQQDYARSYSHGMSIRIVLRELGFRAISH